MKKTPLGIILPKLRYNKIKILGENITNDNNEDELWAQQRIKTGQWEEREMSNQITQLKRT